MKVKIAHTQVERTDIESCLSFVVPGEPVAKARARTFSRKRNDGAVTSRTVTPAKTRAYENKVRTLCAIAVNKARWTSTKNDRFAVTVNIYRSHEGLGGDIDNIAKSALDAIQGPGLAMPDDRYVRDIACRLRQDKVNPRLEIEVRKCPKVMA